MPPKPNFSKEKVIKAAFKLVKKRGLKALTTRNVARKLKSSTAPVYSHFANIKALEKEVVKASRILLLEYMRKPYSNQPFLNMGTGYVMFAMENKNLFRALFMETSRYRHILQDIAPVSMDEMAKDDLLKGLSVEGIADLLNKMWIFTHGLAALVCVGLAEDLDEEQTKAFLTEVGKVMVKEAKRNRAIIS